MPTNYTPLPWKKTFRKIPPAISAVLAGTTADAFVVGCAKSLSYADLEAGVYRHLDVGAVADVPSHRRLLLPSPNVGPASFANATPVEVQVKELGTVPKRIQGSAPSWKGSGRHPTSYVRQVWFTRLAVPAMTLLAIERRDGAPTTCTAANHREQLPVREQAPAGRPEESEARKPIDGEGVQVWFQVEEVLRRTDPDFEPNLLRCLNLLQENVGAVGLVPASGAEAEALARSAEDIGWEVLPPISSDTAEAEILRVMALRQPERAGIDRSRLEVLRDLNPRRLWHSTRGYVGYFLAEFADDLTVFANLETDAALYLLCRPGSALSRLSRTELRAHLGDGAEWIPHSAAWQGGLAERVLAQRGEAPDGQRLLL